MNDFNVILPGTISMELSSIKDDLLRISSTTRELVGPILEGEMERFKFRMAKYEDKYYVLDHTVVELKKPKLTRMGNISKKKFDIIPLEELEIITDSNEVISQLITGEVNYLGDMSVANNNTCSMRELNDMFRSFYSNLLETFQLDVRPLSVLLYESTDTMNLGHGVEVIYASCRMRDDPRGPRFQLEMTFKYKTITETISTDRISSTSLGNLYKFNDILNNLERIYNESITETNEYS